MKNQILKEIKEKGFFWLVPSLWDKFGKSVEELHDEGKIQTLIEAGIDFMNGGYCYVGKPSNVKIVSDKFGSSWLEKG